MTEKRRAIIVAGMHRSGTSALTRVVNLLGADLSHDLVPAGIGNDLGHWESRAVQDLHDRILGELRSDIYSPVNFPPSWFDGPPAKAWIGRIEALASQEYSTSRLFVLKDPRIALLLPLWIAALTRLAIEPHFIIPFRHPFAVAASLEKRERELGSGNALPPAQGVAVWLRYTLAAERFTRGQRRSFVSFEMLLEDWRSELARIGRQLDVAWPRLGVADASIDRFLDSSRRDPAPMAPAGDRAHMCLSVHDGLTRAVADPQTTTVFDKAAEAASTAEEILGAYALIKEHQAAELRAEIDATISRHAIESANAHRSFASEIRARDARIVEAETYARSLERSRDEALSYAASLEQSREETLRYAKGLELRATEPAQAMAVRSAAGSKDKREDPH